MRHVQQEYRDMTFQEILPPAPSRWRDPLHLERTTDTPPSDLSQSGVQVLLFRTFQQAQLPSSCPPVRHGTVRRMPDGPIRVWEIH